MYGLHTWRGLGQGRDGPQVNKLEQVHAVGRGGLWLANGIMGSGHMGIPYGQTDATENITFSQTMYMGGNKVERP